MCVIGPCGHQHLWFLAPVVSGSCGRCLLWSLVPVVVGSCGRQHLWLLVPVVVGSCDRRVGSRDHRLLRSPASAVGKERKI